MMDVAASSSGVALVGVLSGGETVDGVSLSWVGGTGGSTKEKSDMLDICFEYEWWKWKWSGEERWVVVVESAQFL